MNLTRRLTEGVGAWLHFEFCCHRNGLFNERYLSAAVGQILSSTYGDQVHGEFRHPILAATMTGSGRRPALDFVYCSNYPNITVAVETKWAGSSHTTVESIIWDLIRLELVANHYHDASCIFLLAGQRASLTKLFRSSGFAGPQGTPGRIPILSVYSNTMFKLSLLPDKDYRIPIYRDLFANAQTIAIPCQIITRRADPFPGECKAKHFQVYAWEVLPAVNRKEFIPANINHYRIRPSG